jgi:hypothetical protein
MKRFYTQLCQLLMFICLGVIAACASNPGPTAEEIAHSTHMQAEWFGSLAPAQALQTVVSAVAHYQQASFEVLEDGVLHQYLQGQIPDTNVLFGVYFKDGELDSLILDQRVGDFAWCRKRAWPKGYWLEQGFSAFGSWLAEHNQLNGSFDTGMRHPRISTDPMNASDVAEAATYLPVIAIALPLYGVERLAGGITRDKKKRAINQKLKEAALQMVLGQVTRDELLQLMGSADRREILSDTEIWRYRDLGIWFGIVDGVVMWKESGPFYPPRNSSFTFDRVDCGGIEPHTK